MALTFEYILNTSESSIEPLLADQNFITNEPNGDILNYFVKNYRAKEKVQKYEPVTEYDKIYFTKITTRLTTRSVARIGIKAFPRIGSYGFYKDKYTGLSNVLVPINIKRDYLAAPTLQMEQLDKQIKFIITNPKDVTYKCFRIILALDSFAYEYVTYDTEFICDMPKVKGIYDIHCIGYVEEGQYVSYISNSFTLEVIDGKESFAPDNSTSYYTKEQIDNMFGDIGNLLDKLNGVVI